MASTRFTNANTESARSAALASFDRFLAKHQVARANVFELIAQDSTGEVLGRTLDQYALYLVAADGARGKRLEQSTVTQYFRTAKSWLLDQYPQQEALIRRRMKITSASLKHRFKAVGHQGRQAPTCSKTDLCGVADVIYQTASAEVDYHDAALLIRMWYLLGRSSDMSFLAKQNIVVHPGGVLSLRFGRIKTGVDQGLALFGSKDALSCPIHALAMMAATEQVPSDIIFRYLPKYNSDDDTIGDFPEDLLLSEMFQEHIEREAVSSGAVKTGATIHSYVNRTLRRIAELHKHTQIPFSKALTSHSFRRGGAQAANANANNSLQWILDRGGWQLSSLNRGFFYIFNTTTEDQQVAKVLSGWEPNRPVWQPSIAELDSTTRAQVAAVQARLFATESDHCEFAYKDEVLNVFMATVLYHYPAVRERLPHGPYQAAVARALKAVGHSEADMLAWALALRHKEMVWAKQQQEILSTKFVPEASPAAPDSKLESLLSQQVDLIRNLVKQNNQLHQRIGALESRMAGHSPESAMRQSLPADTMEEIEFDSPAAKRRRAAQKSLHDVWMIWYTSRPPLYESNTHVSKQRYSDYKLVVAYMRLFLSDGYTLCPESGFVAEVRRVGTEAETAPRQRLTLYGARGTAHGTALKALKRMHDHGALDNLIEEMRARIQDGKVVDSTPAEKLLPARK